MDRTFLFVATTPPGTPIANPVSTPAPLEDAKLANLRIVIPSGHVGLTGIRLLQSGQQIFPWDNNQYLVGNDRVVDVPMDHEITISGLVIETYNLGQFPHNHYVEIVIADLPLAGSQASAAFGGTAVVSSEPQTQADPLSPEALIASLPPDAMLEPLPDLTMMAG